MHVVNCHQNTEAADLLGGLRPLRGRDILIEEFRTKAKSFVKRCSDTLDGVGNEDEDAVEDTRGREELSLDTLGVAELMAAVQVRREAEYVVPCHTFVRL